MRPFTFGTSVKTIAVAGALLAVPLAGASAAQFNDHTGRMMAPTPTSFQGPRADSILNQVQGIDQGIADARQANAISPAEAHTLEMRAANISKIAERTAAADHGRLPGGQYHQLLRRVDHLDQRLLTDTGSGFVLGDGSDGGNYPNG